MTSKNPTALVFESLRKFANCIFGSLPGKINLEDYAPERDNAWCVCQQAL